ncbi:protein of unknown function [Kaistella jeonii]|nr:protein of unknown function [Kaistella jeonii]VEI94441.1 Uncharacterised protein [Kaistella jeonii]
MVLFLPLLLLNSCRDQADKNWTNPEASIKLYNTTLSSNTLYPTMADNSFRLTWDGMNGETGNYTIQFSKTADFATPVTFATSTKNTYTTTVRALNTAILQQGYSPYTQTLLYIRVILGTNLSNVISVGITPYPVAIPVITSPTSGQAIVLDGANPNVTAATIKWNDYAYGGDVKYNVEIAASGSANFFPLGTVQNAKMLEVSHLVFDKAVLKTGAIANIASNIDIKVTASSTSVGGTIVKVSDIVTFKVTPYQLESFLYVPGAYQNWDPLTAESLRSATSNGIYIGYINYTAPNSEFKITTARNWDNSYGTTGGYNITYNGGNNLVAPNIGYQKLTVDTNSLTYALEAYSWGIIGSATPGGWDNDTDLLWNSTTQKWEINNIVLSVGEIKFRLNNDWGTNYGDDGNNGSLEPSGANIPITEAGNYKITFDEENLVWTKTKL